MNRPTTIAIDEKTFDWGLGCVPPMRQSMNRHAIGEIYCHRNGRALYACNFRLVENDGSEHYFQSVMTLEEFDSLDALKYRRQFLPACYKLHVGETLERPAIAFRCIVWNGNIDPSARNSSNLSDGAQFRFLHDAEVYIRRVKCRGGKLCQLRTIENPTFCFDSLKEFDTLGKMTADEIQAFSNRYRLETLERALEVIENTQAKISRSE